MNRNLQKLLITLLLVGAIVAIAACGMRTNLSQGSKLPHRDTDPSLRVFIATDLHYISPHLTDNGEYFMRMIDNADAKAMHFSEEIMEGFVTAVINEKPDYLILSGDLSFNGEKASHEELAAKLSRIEESGTEVLVISGNHDVYSETAASFSGSSYEFVDNVSATGFSRIYSDFGFEEAIARDEASLSYVYELSPSLRALVVDVNTRLELCYLREETLEWVHAQLEQAKEDGVKVIAVSHQNLLQHSPLFAYGYLIQGHGRLTQLYEEYGVLTNLSGHMHIQHISKSENGLVDIATSALSVSPYQYGILEFYDDGIDYHTEFTDFPHREEAVSFMRDRSLRTAVTRFPELSDDHQNFYADINVAYFAGRTDSIKWDTKLYNDLLENSSSSSYLESIYDDGLENQTEIYIELDQ